MKTTSKVLADLRAALVQAYENQLAGMRCSKKAREGLVAGFKDGVNYGVHHTIQMLGVEVVDESSKD